MYTPDDHIDDIGKWFITSMASKYHEGQEEHGGKLWRKSTLLSMEEEILDFAVYYYTHKMQMLKMFSLLTELLRDLDEGDTKGAINSATMAINLLTVGNEEGMEEEENA